MNLKHFINRIVSVADEISTRPNLTSWRWKGTPSLLSCIFLYIVYFARLCSLLQYFKFIYRKRSNATSVDKASMRGNVPSWLVELYFIVWAILLFALPKELPFIKWISFYFIFESLFWLLYYFFFRRFFEERYAIMHTLEYVVLLPLLVITQARCISVISNCGIRCAFATMFFPGKNDDPYIIILSVFYTALIFGIILSNLPIEQIKEIGNYRFNISIVGNGDIVNNRLKNAINELYPPRNVAILDLKRPKQENNDNIGKTKYHYFLLSDENEKHILSSNILWIATPPFAHLSYLNKYIGKVFIAVEKPIVTSPYEMTVIKQLMNSKLWEKVFCLSYYYLEKSLPLTFLYTPSTFYEKYLSFSLTRQEILSLFEQFGKLRSIELTLFEEEKKDAKIEDNRIWVESPEYGGHIFETFLHLAVIARAVIGKDSDWGSPEWTIENVNGHYMSYIKCEGITSDSNVCYNLEMRQNVQKKQRRGKLQFDNGVIIIDFDEQEMIGTLQGTSTRAFTIKTKEEYKTRYSIQVDMVERCIEDNIVPAIIDGSELQIKTIDWLFAQKRNWSAKVKQT